MGVKTSSSFTRPSNTTAYAAGDLVADTTVAASVVPLSFTYGFCGDLRRVTISTNNATITLGSFNLWILRSAPTLTNGDNGALAGVVLTTVVAVIPLELDASMSGAGGFGEAYYDPGLIQFGNGTYYGLLEARAAYVPASAEVFTVTLELNP